MPERYLDKPLAAADYVNVADPYTRDHFTYGGGRRICPGIHVAERSLYINIVRVLWGFNISKAKDSNGRPVEPVTKMVPGFLTVPLPFECDIQPRSEKHAKIMRDSFARAEAEGLQYN